MIQFTLKAPLQSWGLEKIRGGDYFPTDIKPTKSGIIGLIACVMGLERGNPRIEELNKALTVYVYSHPNDGIMTDFHIIHVSNERPQYLANGTRSVGDQANSIVTYRSYIQSGEFDITLEGDEALLDEITKAFNAPYWTPYLGRKSCSVSAPILPTKVTCVKDGSVKVQETNDAIEIKECLNFNDFFSIIPA